MLAEEAKQLRIPMVRQRMIDDFKVVIDAIEKQR
jgi:hypothetical protein